jgi:hypothetical protein
MTDVQVAIRVRQSCRDQEDILLLVALTFVAAGMAVIVAKSYACECRAPPRIRLQNGSPLSDYVGILFKVCEIQSSDRGNLMLTKREGKQRDEKIFLSHRDPIEEL